MSQPGASPQPRCGLRNVEVALGAGAATDAAYRSPVLPVPLPVSAVAGQARFANGEDCWAPVESGEGYVIGQAFATMSDMATDGG